MILFLKISFWTIWDQFTPHECYDSIEYCIHFGCPLLTRQ
ncbi:unnamed protein product, partial [Rotaria sp. Silwood2]